MKYITFGSCSSSKFLRRIWHGVLFWGGSQNPACSTGSRLCLEVCLTDVNEVSSIVHPSSVDRQLAALPLALLAFGLNALRRLFFPLAGQGVALADCRRPPQKAPRADERPMSAKATVLFLQKNISREPATPCPHGPPPETDPRGKMTSWKTGQTSAMVSKGCWTDPNGCREEHLSCPKTTPRPGTRCTWNGKTTGL